MSLASLHRLSLLIGSSLERERECAAFMDWIRSEVEPRRAALFVAAPGRESLIPAAVSGFRKPPRGVLPAGHDPWSWLEAQKLSLPRGERYALPILLEGELFGLLAVISAQKDEALSEEQRLLDLALAYLAPILRNIEHYENVERTVEERTAQLRQSEERFRTLAETTATAIFVYSGEKFIYANRATEELTGYTAAELLAMRFWDVVHPDFREMIRQRGLARQRGEQVPSRYEFKIVRKDGEERWVDFTAGKIEWQGQPAAIGSAFDITERKAAETRLRSVVEQVPLVTYTESSQDGRTIFISPQIQALSGYTPEEWMSDASLWKEIIHPDDRPRVVAENDRTNQNGEPFRVEYRLITRGGEIRWVRDESVLIRDESGAPLYWQGFMLDITERKRAESLRLRLSEVLEAIASDEALPKILERLVRAIEEYQPDIKGSVLLLDADGACLQHGAAPSLPDDYNAAVHGLLIGPRAGSCGTAAYEKRLVIVEDIQTDPLWADYRELAARHGLRACWSQPIIDRDGEVLGTFALYYDKPRKPTEAELDLINTAANVAGIAIKRKRAEEAVKHSERRLSALIANGLDFISLLDAQGSLLWESPSTTTMLGYRFNEFLGRSVLELVHPEELEWAQHQFAELVATPGSRQSGVFRLKRANGEYRWVEAVVSNFLDDPAVNAIVINYRDITERKRDEEALRESEERFRAYIERASDYIFTLDSQGNFTFANDAMCAALGYREKDLLGKPALAVVAPEARQEAARILQRLWQGEPIDYIDLPVHTREGKTLVVQIRGRAFHRDGQLIETLHIARDITLQKQAEEAVKNSERRLSALIANGLDFISLLDAQGNLLWESPSSTSLLGYRFNEFLGRNILELVHPEDLEWVQRQFAEVAAAPGSRQSGIFRMKRADGEYRWVEAVASNFLDDPAVNAIVINYRDITERKTAETRLRSVVEQVPLVTYTESSQGGRKIFVSPQIQALSGYTPEEWMADPALWKNTIHPDDRPGVIAEDDRTNQTGEPFRIEYRLVARSGEIRWVRDESVLIRDESGAPLYWQGFMLDITERKQAEEELRTRELQYRSLFEQSHDAIFILDLDGRHLVVNQRAADLLGYSTDELLALSFREISAELPQSENVLERLLRGEHVPLYERKFRRKNGEIIEVEINVELVRDAQGKPLHIQSVVRDITARKHHERQLEAQAMLARALGESLELQPLLERLLEAARHAIPAAEKGSILLLEADGRLRIRALNGYTDPRLKEFAFASNSGYSARAARERRPLLIADARADPEIRYDGEIEEARQIHGAIAVPLLIQERVIGVISLDSTQKNVFTQKDLDHLVGFAASAALVIENARLFEVERRERHIAEQLTRALAAGASLTSLLDSDRVLDRLLESVEQVIPFNGANIMLIDRENGKVRIARLRGYRHLDERARQIIQNLSFDLATTENLRWLCEHKQPLVIPDVSRYPGWIPIEESPIRSWIGAPILINNQVEAFFSLDSLTPNFFSDEHVLLLQAFAGQASLALQNARLFEQTRRRAEETASLLNASLSLSSLDLQETLQTIGERARRLFAADGCRIFLLEPDGKTLRCVLALAESEVAFADLTIPLGYGVTGHVALTGEAEIVNDMLNDPRAQTVPGTEEESEAIMFAPLKSGKQTIGVISIRRVGSERPFQPNDLDLLKAFASLAASAVSNARLFEGIQARLKELEILQTLSTSLRQARAVEEMLPLFIQYAARAVDAAAGSIYLWEEASGEWVSRGWMTADGRWQTGTADLRHRPGEGVTGWVGERGEIYVTTDWRADPTNQPLPHEMEFLQSLTSGISLPLKAEARVIGVMHLWYAGTHDFNEEEKRLLTAVADMAGNAIQRARLHDETTQQVKRLTALRDIDRAIASSFDLNLVFTFLLNGILTQLKADAADILLFEPHTNTLYQAAKRGFRSTRLSNVHLRLDESLAGRAALERTLVAIPNLYEAAEGFSIPEFLEGENFKAYYAYPLVAKGELKGVLEVFHRAPLFVTSNWLDFFETLAGQAAIAIDNARLFENLERSNLELMLAYDETIEGWSRALDLRDKETEGHTRRVTELTLKLAAQLGISSADMAHIRRGALLHDIGKVGVPDSILLKPAPLTDEEQRIMRRHPQFAYDMLAPIAYLRPALDIPYCHHEKWDGTGYPRGLKGEEIPLPARIFAVADVYDALTSDRPYRKAWTKEEALEYIRQQSGSHFDPQVVKKFIELIAEKA